MFFFCSFYIHKSVFNEMDKSSCDMLDHANVNFSSSPLHQLLTLLKLKASNKVAHVLIRFASFQNDLVFVFPKCLYAYLVQDDFSLGDLSTTKLQRILRVSKSSWFFPPTDMSS